MLVLIAVSGKSMKLHSAFFCWMCTGGMYIYVYVFVTWKKQLQSFHSVNACSRIKMQFTIILLLCLSTIKSLHCVILKLHLHVFTLVGVFSPTPYTYIINLINGNN